MTTTLIASLFCMDNFLPILIGLLGAGLLGWLLKGFLKTGGGSNELQTKYDRLAADFHKERERNNKLMTDKKKKGGNSNNEGAAAMAVAAAATGVSVSEHEQLKNKVKNLQGELKSAQDAKVAIDGDLQAAKNRASEANALHSEVATQKTRLDGLLKALDTSKEEAAKFKSEFEFANSERSKLSTQLASSDLGALQKQIEKLEKDLNDSRLQSSLLQTENASLKNGPKTLGANMEVKAPKAAVDLSDDLKAVQAELAKTKESNARLQMQHDTNKLAINAAVNEANSKTNTEVGDLRRKLKLAEAELALAKSENTRMAASTSSSNVVVAAVAEIKPEPIKVVVPIIEEVAAPVVEEVVEEVATPIAEEVASPEIIAEAQPIEEEVIAEEAAPVIMAEEAAPIVEEVVAKHEPTDELAFDFSGASNEDDLTIIEGIGPKIGEMIKAKGIKTFIALADASVDTLQSILDEGGAAYKVHNPGTWAEQAALLRDGKMDEFKALCDVLNGGVRD
jgi:predicted flap endonuclease-1-like 5' DNA nuclease